MLRKTLLALLLALPTPAFAAATFFWDCESATLGAGSYSAGDTTATASSDISISSSSPLKGSNSCLTSGAQDYYILDSASIAATGEGAFGLLFRWTTTGPTATAVYKPLGAVDSGDDDGVGFTASTGGSGIPRFNIRQQGSAAESLSLSSTTIAADTTYYMTAGWDIAGDRRFIRLYNGSTCALIEEAVDTSTDLGADQPGNFDQVRIGNSTGLAVGLRMDTVVWASDYDDPVVDACPWTSFFPTFSGVTGGTPGETTLTVNYTPDQVGTAKWVACPDGQTANHAQILAGNCSGGAAAASFTEAGVAGVGETEQLTGLASGTTYDLFGTYTNSLGGAKASAQSLANQTTDAGSGGPVFDTGPTITGIANGFRIAGEVDVTATVYFAGLNPGVAAPADCDALQLLSGTAMYFGSESWTGGAADTFDVTAADLPPRVHGYVCAENGGGISDVATSNNVDRLPRSGYSIVTMASHSASGLCGLDSFYNPDCADPDVFEYQSATVEAPNCYANISTTGHLVLFDHTDGSNNGGLDSDAGDDSIVDCGGPGIRRTLGFCTQDVSENGDGEFTAPACWGADEILAVNNSTPNYTGAAEYFLYQKDIAIDSSDLSNRWEDTDGDAVVVTLTATPTGLTVTNSVLAGTPTVCQSVPATERGTDLFDDFDEVAIEIEVGGLIPASEGLTPAQLLTAVQAVCPAMTTVAGASAYSSTVAEGAVISTNPVNGWLSPPDQVVTYYLSLGGGPPAFIGDLSLLLAVDEAMTPIVLADRWSSTDIVTVTFQDTLPTGLSVSAGELIGTPTDCQTVIATERGTVDGLFYTEVETTIAIGARINVVGMTEAAAIAAIEAACQ